MDLLEVLDQVRTLLQSKGRLTYRLLKAQFQLSDEALDALKEELIEGEQIATDENGRVLVWTGGGALTAGAPSTLPHLQSPASYTPPHLAERIRAEQATLEARGA